MDDGELAFSNQELFPDPDVFSSSNLGERSMDMFLDEILRDAHACTHTHTCNPPGPDSSHTHTCFHVHTKIVPASNEDKVSINDTSESTEKKASKKQPLGNREAVRKYREKKKARAASLEDEVVRLRALNQQLLKRLQGQADTEAEIARLKCLLVDIRGRIKGEIGSFPYQKTAGSTKLPEVAHTENPCNMQCGDQVYCLHPGAEGKNGDVNTDGAIINDGQGYRSCEKIENLLCLANHNDPEIKEYQVCGLGSAASSAWNKTEG